MNRGSRIALLCAFAWALASSAEAQTTIYESATFVPPESSWSSYIVSDTWWQGVAFTTTESHRISTIGGYIYGSGGDTSVFVAILPTDGTLPTGAPHDTTNALFIEAVTLGTSTREEHRVAADFTLPPGNWSIVFGSNAAGATGRGSMPATNIEIGSPKYFYGTSSGWVDVSTQSRKMRFFIEGSVADPVCGNGWIEDGEECDGDGQGTGGPTPECSGGCVVIDCGNGSIEGDEVCDDGDQNGVYGRCSVTCDGDGPRCGDGIPQSIEACDDGNVSNRDACLNDCMEAVCGDRYVHRGVEECDDGNSNNGDNCSNECQTATGTTRRLEPEADSGGCQVVRAEARPRLPVWIGFAMLVVLARRRQNLRRVSAVATQ